MWPGSFYTLTSWRQITEGGRVCWGDPVCLPCWGLCGDWCQHPSPSFPSDPGLPGDRGCCSCKGEPADKAAQRLRVGLSLEGPHPSPSRPCVRGGQLVIAVTRRCRASRLQTRGCVYWNKICNSTAPPVTHTTTPTHRPTPPPPRLWSRSGQPRGGHSWMFCPIQPLTAATRVYTPGNWGRPQP